MRTYRQPPPIVNGYPIDDVHRFWIVVPEEGTNLITNPSLETNTTGWTLAGSASIARSTTQQRRGAYSLAITMTAATGDGAYYGTVSLTSGTTYTYSIDVYAPAGMPLKAYFATTGGVQVGGVRSFKGTGRWQRVSITYTETSTTTRRLYLTKDASTKTGTVYLDGAQLEAKAYPTTYIDGDQRGLVPNQFPIAYTWTGTAHASTSTRSGQTRAGGRLVPLSRYGFSLLGIAGLGLVTPNVVATPYAQIDGAQYERSQKPPRQFTLAGRFDATTPRHLQQLRGDLLSVLDRDLVGLDQPLVLRYQGYDCDMPTTEEAEIVCAYTGGLEGNVSNHYTEAVSAVFQMHAPMVRAAGDNGTTLSPNTTIAMDNISQRAPDGAWSEVGTGVSAGGGVFDIVIGLDGKVYAAGAFTSMAGVANTSRIAYWDGSAWNAMGTGAAGGTVDTLAVGPDGKIYAGGAFTSMGGVANTSRIAYWDGSAWNAMGTGANGSVSALQVGADGSIYAGGAFTLMGGVANTARIAKWNGSAWNAMGTGALNFGVSALALGLDGSIYAGGAFTQMGGIANTVSIAKWSGSIWSALSTGISGGSASVQSMVVGANNILSIGGDFTTAGGVSVANMAQWNGVAWTPMGDGLGPAGSGVAIDDMVVFANGTIAATGDFDAITGSRQLPDNMAIWNGATWVPFDIDLDPGGSPAPVYSIQQDSQGRIYIGGVYGTSSAASVTAITNTGSARAHPRITITGPTSSTSKIWNIINNTTGRSVHFNNLTMVPGEIAALCLDPQNLSFTSTLQGNIVSKIAPGSNEADFFLQPGVNSISFLAERTTVTITMSWTPNNNSLDDLAYTP
jgi:hypothetical protein